MCEIDLTPFCDPDSYRYDLSEPFVQGGWKYATDSRAIVRVPCDEPDTVSADPKRKQPRGGDIYPPNFPECDGALGDRLVRMASGSTFNAHSDVCGCGSKAEMECADCDGSGKEECRACYGEGRVECFECGHEHDCDDCDGEGGVGECMTCKGTGVKPGSEPCSICTVENPRIVCPVGAGVIARAYWLKLRNLPGLRVRPSLGPEQPVYFTFDGGGQGIVMCINADVLNDDLVST